MSIVRMRKNMQSWAKYVMLGLAAIFAVGIIGIGIGSGRYQGERADTAGLVAKVNGEKLDRKTFEPRFEKRVEEMEKTRMLSALEGAQLRGQVFDDMVDQMLRVQAAREEGLKASRREVKMKTNELIEDQIKQLREQLLAGYKGKKTEQAFENELKRNDLSLAKIKTDIRKGIDPDLVRQYILVEKLVEKLKSGMDASDNAIRESYEEVRMRQITVSSRKRSEIQAEQRARELAQKLRKGADFASFAKEYSDDPYRGAGGDRGYFLRRAYMESELASAAFKLKPGEISDPVKMPQGYVIVKVEERRSSLPPDFNDPNKRKGYREAYLAQEQFRTQSKYFSDLRRNAKISVYDAELKGYLQVKELSTMLGTASPAELKAKAEQAIKEYQRAAMAGDAATQVTARAYAQIAYLYDWLRRPGPASPSKDEQAKYLAETKKALQSALDYSESNDLRMMVADINIEEGEYDKALEQLAIMSENAFEDYEAHRQVLSRYERMKGIVNGSGLSRITDLIAQEREWIADYEKRMREQQAGQTGVPLEVAPEPQKPSGSEKGSGE